MSPDSYVLVDGHVHGHTCFGFDEILDSASRSFLTARRRSRKDQSETDVLMITEAHGEGFVSRVREREAGRRTGRWSVAPTEEAVSWLAACGGERRLCLIGGRQIATREGLELLALGTCSELADGETLRETVTSIRQCGALVVAPWGFGKWWFRRGRLIRALIGSADARWFFLGDNGGRPRLSRRPPVFDDGGRAGIRILPGSDPLPFPPQVRRIGSFGFALDGALCERRPWADICARLTSPDTDPAPFGAGIAWIPFILAQVRMQLRKRRQ